jgi:hypothetical protein
MSPSVELQEAEPQPAAPALLNHLIDERKHVCRNVKTDRPGGSEIEDERIHDGQLHRQVAPIVSLSAARLPSPPGSTQKSGVLATGTP